MGRDPGRTTDQGAKRRNGAGKRTVQGLVQAGEILLKVFLATALTVGVLRTREVEAGGQVRTAPCAPAPGGQQALSPGERARHAVLLRPLFAHAIVVASALDADLDRDVRVDP